MVQSVSDTRWSARSDAMRALFKNYSEIKQSLISIAEHPGQTPSAIQEAKSLAKKLDTFETALMCTIWNDLLQNLNIVNKATQEPGIELSTVVRLYDSLLTYLSEIRTQFNSFELKAKELSECDYKNTQTYEKIFFDEDSIDATADTVSNMCASDRFPTQTHRRPTCHSGMGPPSRDFSWDGYVWFPISRICMLEEICAYLQRQLKLL